MAKSKHARSRHSGGKKGRGANPQTRRNLLASDSDDPFTRSESIDTLPGGEGEMDEEGEGQHLPESSSLPFSSSRPPLLYPSATDVIITVPVAMWVSFLKTLFITRGI
jgi:hypothetical protein